MLTQKDCCDYDTCVALEELGFSSVNNEYFQSKIVSKEIPLKFFDTTLQGTSLEYAPIISLYEAQKWLREEKFLFIVVDRLLNGEYVFSIVDILNYSEEKNGTANSYEEALSEGIKEALNLLNEEK